MNVLLWLECQRMWLQFAASLECQWVLTFLSAAARLAFSQGSVPGNSSSREKRSWHKPTRCHCTAAIKMQLTFLLCLYQLLGKLMWEQKPSVFIPPHILKVFKSALSVPNTTTFANSGNSFQLQQKENNLFNKETGHVKSHFIRLTFSADRIMLCLLTTYVRYFH